MTSGCRCIITKVKAVSAWSQASGWEWKMSLNCLNTFKNGKKKMKTQMVS